MRQGEKKKELGERGEKSDGETRPSRTWYINYYAVCGVGTWPEACAGLEQRCINSGFTLDASNERLTEKGCDSLDFHLGDLSDATVGESGSPSDDSVAIVSNLSFRLV